MQQAQRPLCRARHTALLHAAGVIAWLCTAPVGADAPPGVAACRDLADDHQRLACYDTLWAAPAAAAAKPVSAPVVSTSPPTAVAAPIAAPIAETEAPTMPEPTASPVPPVSPAAPPASVAAAPPAAPAAAPASAAPQSFGGELLAGKTTSTATDLNARVLTSLDGVKQGTVFPLDNGQVWVSIDDREYFYEGDNPSAVIRRNLMGGYWMTLEHAHFGIHVSRIK